MITLPFFSAWILMLILGALGHQLHQPKLFIGYWVCFLICMAIHLIGWLLRGGND